MSVINIGNSSYNSFFRKIYSGNRNASKSENRLSVPKEDLYAADTRALKRICSNLKEISYEKENGEDVFKNVKAFVDTYNNLMDSSGKITDDKLEREMKKFKKEIKEFKDDLESVGVSISSSGKLNLDEDKLKECSITKVQNVFGKDDTVTTAIIQRCTGLSRLSEPLKQAADALKGRQKDAMEDLIETIGIMNEKNIDIKA